MLYIIYQVYNMYKYHTSILSDASLAFTIQRLIKWNNGSNNNLNHMLQWISWATYHGFFDNVTNDTMLSLSTDFHVMFHNKPLSKE